MVMQPPSTPDPLTPIVFVLEDDSDLRSILEMIIGRAGYHVVSSGSRKEFLSHYQPAHPGCLVLDFHTPGCSAIDLYQDLTEAGARHPFLIVSGKGSVPCVAEAMRMGAVDFLCKPIDHAVLCQRIAEAVERDRKGRKLLSERDELESSLSTLSKRENQILSMLVEGIPSKKIAKHLEIGTSTVDVHRSNIMKKMGVKSSIELAGLMVRKNLLMASSASQPA